jgi:serine/threonine-protein kinase HipA
MPSLAVWMNGQRVGTWTQGTGLLSQFVYAQSWVESEFFRPLSLSIPLTADLKVRGAQVTNYFDNLLPDNEAIRKRISARFSVRADTFALLTAIGRDCVGAVQLLPMEMLPTGWDEIRGAKITEARIAAHLRNVTAPAAGIGSPETEEPLRISIAGAQEKTALLRMGNAWFWPEGATPTTHILKLPLGIIGGGLDFRHSVENEWLCAQFLAAIGMNVARTEMQQFEDVKVLVVERFDRRWVGVNEKEIAKKRFLLPKGAHIARLPQEDFCQALGLPMDKKYESHGGPTMKDALHLLSSSAEEARDKAHFVVTQLMFWLLAAADGHAKNFSLHLEAGGHTRLTPLYDVLSAWPLIGRGPAQLQYEKTKLAMALRSKNAHYRLNAIQTRHWKTLADFAGVQGLWEQMVAQVGLAPRIIGELESRLPNDFPPQVYEKIRKGITQHTQAFAKGL